jgi:hypothetical protein
MNVRAAVAPLLVLLATACSAEVGDDAPAESSDALTTSGVKAFTVHQSAGFMPPPPAGACLPSGEWTVMLADKRLVADACVGGRSVRVDRALSDAEVTSARKALSRIRVAPQPTACPTDAPVLSLSVKRARSETFYVEERSACDGSLAVTGTSMHSLLDAVTALTPVAPAVAGASTCNGSPCFSLKGTCWDRGPSGATTTSYANETFTYVPPTGANYEHLAWSDDGSMATSRATSRLTAWLRNAHGVFVDGVRRGMSPYWDGTNVSVFVTAKQTSNGIELTMDSTGGSWCTLEAPFQE